MKFGVFSSSGDILHVTMQRDDERFQVAFVTFKDAGGAESAVLLSAETIINSVVIVALDPDYESPNMKSVKVSNISLRATVQDVREFFSSSGDILHVAMQSDDEQAQVAFVTFKDVGGAESAVLLSRNSFLNSAVTVSLDPDYKSPPDGAFVLHPAKTNNSVDFAPDGWTMQFRGPVGNQRKFYVSPGGRQFQSKPQVSHSLKIQLDTLNVLLVIATPAADVVKLLEAIKLQKEEMRLFQFLNGLDDQYNAQRSQLLLNTHLPYVEIACSALEQEEAQRNLLGLNKEGGEVMAMNIIRVNPDRNAVCTTCGVKGHVSEICWQNISYPRWHPKSGSNKVSSPGKKMQPTKWNNTQKRNNGPKFAAATQSEESSGFTQHQLEQLAKLVPQLVVSQSRHSDTDEEIDYHFSGMLSCFSAKTNGSGSEWIVDSGATDHMTGDLKLLTDAKVLTGQKTINLPTGFGTKFSHTGQVHLAPHLCFQNVLYVPSFKHNLVFMQRLIKDNNYEVQFFTDHCVIADKHTKKLHAIGTVRNGLYYVDSTTLVNPTCLAVQSKADGDIALWHHRLGNTSLADKFDQQGVPCVFIGYPPHQKGYKLLDLATKKEFVSRDVVFHERIFPYHKNVVQNYMAPVPPSMPQYSQVNDADDLIVSETVHTNTPSSPVSQSSARISDASPSSVSESNILTPDSTTVVHVRRSTRVHVTPVWMSDFVTNTPSQSISNLAYTSINENFHCFLSTVTSARDPISFSKAVTKEEWVHAMNCELEALELNSTWEIVPLPTGKHAIGSKWIFKMKYLPNESVDKHKARLVVLGYHKRPGEDYFETFAPVAKLTTV
ncbi:uncharacterized protein LOC141686088 [Apium graveolens]|uniref:uncharacterized protein LOC141686088 n=1 Tax=Apium graveolens TaxID=4045 RepID=UPI003D7AEF93